MFEFYRGSSTQVLRENVLLSEHSETMERVNPVAPKRFGRDFAQFEQNKFKRFVEEN
jgi:hypothetical protein